MTITLPPEIESRLNSEAQRRGVDAETYVRDLLDRNLPHEGPFADQATIDVLNQWEADTFTDDPEELARRQREFEEFKGAMNRNRLETEGPNARVPFP